VAALPERHSTLRFAGQNVERGFGKNQAIEFAEANGADKHGAFARSSRVVTKNLPWDGSAPVAERPTRWSATAIERGELMWQTRSTVRRRCEFERCGRYQDFYLAFFQFAFGFEAQLAREASV